MGDFNRPVIQTFRPAPFNRGVSAAHSRQGVISQREVAVAEKGIFGEDTALGCQCAAGETDIGDKGLHVLIVLCIEGGLARTAVVHQ